MVILIFETHQPLSAIISPFQFTKHHSSEGCLFTLEKTCDIECLKPIRTSSSEKLISGNKNQFCQSNLEKQKKNK